MSRPPCDHNRLICPAIDWADKEIGRLRERLGPRGLEVVEINCAGHYVNEKVKAEIERLRRIVDLVMEHDSNLIDCLERHSDKR